MMELKFWGMYVSDLRFMESKAEAFLQGSLHFTKPIYVIASRASKSAIKAIELSGGKVVCKFYNTLALLDCVEGRIDRLAAAPTRREDISTQIHYVSFVLRPDRRLSLVWYGKHQNRGFISPATLKSLEGMPFLEERWKQLSTELGRWKKQQIIVNS